MTNQEAARAMFVRTRQEHFALGSFNIDNQETLKAVALAAQATKSPVLVEVSHGEVEAIGAANLRCLVDNYKAEYGVTMFLNLDHSPTVAACKQAIDLGYEFIHIDISQANHDATDEEIIEATREVVEYAKRTGALVESEPHYFGGSSNVHAEAIDYEEIKKTFSTPEGAKAFVAATGIDTFAAAVGNLHGLYPVPKELHLDLLQTIRDAIPCAISLHGGSGTPPEQFRSAIQIGVSKININSAMRKTFRTSLEAEYAAHPDVYDWTKITPPVLAAVQQVVNEEMTVFGSVGKV